MSQLDHFRYPLALPCWLLLVLWLTWPGATSAATPEDDARALARVAAPYKGWQMGRLRLEGIPPRLEKTLRKGLVLVGTPRLGGLLGHKRPALTLDLLAADADRILLLLARNGYPWARLDARAAAQSRRRVKIVLRVETGPAIQIDSLRLEGLDDPALAGRRAGLLALLPQPGGRFQDEAYRSGSRAVEESLRGVGRARATCTSEVRRADSLHVSLEYQVRPGPACRVDSLVVTGVQPDLIRLARRSLSPLRGRPCTTRLLDLAQERLSLLGVYRQIRFQLLDPPAGRADPGALTLQADLAPRAPQLLEAGVGWWTTEGGRVSARWSHANLFGGGRGLQVGGSLSRVRQTGRVEAWWPALILPTLRGEIQLLQDRQQEENYHLLNRELRVGGRVQPSLVLTFSGGLAVSVVNLDEFSPDSTAYLARPGRQTVFNVQALRNSTDDPLDPRSGTLTSFQSEWTLPGFFSTANYLRLEGERAAYRSLGSFTGAARLHLGLAWPLGNSPDLLPNRRFFAGGMDHRGFGRHLLGPLDEQGASTGGQALALGSLELRVPLVWRLGLALFVDAGQVWSSPGAARFRELEYAVGPALLLRTPIGPVRTDLGLRVGAADDELDPWALHVSIGHSF
ncbi:MAG: BamA/TamA family outer membrane protein [Candidatus Delongbacteria bacterium]